MSASVVCVGERRTEKEGIPYDKSAEAFFLISYQAFSMLTHCRHTHSKQVK